MSSLTSRQYSLLKILLEADKPLPATALGKKMNLTSRQIHYDLQGMRPCLEEYGISIQVTPRVGVSLTSSPEQRQALPGKLVSENRVQLVLPMGERCQMLALMLLASDTSMILAKMQWLAQITRTTAIKDLDAIDAWFREWGIASERRPNFGYWVNAPEAVRRQLIQALLWGCSPFKEPIAEINYKEGIKFLHQGQAHLLPLVGETQKILKGWDARAKYVTVAFAEAQLGGRFTDEAVLQLGLAFAIQSQRVHAGKFVEIPAAQLKSLQQNPVWGVAVKTAQRLAESPYDRWPESEIASIAMYLLSAARNERWPDDIDMDAMLEETVTELIRRLTEAYRSMNLAEDRTLYDGIVNHLVPAYYGQRFGIWLPPSLPEFPMTDQDAGEMQLVEELSNVFFARTNVKLSAENVASIAMLLRAALLREQAGRQRRVLVVCPSGMATAQLLMARLKVYFPGLGIFKVISLRDLSPQFASTAYFIITTVPLPPNATGQVPVLQVHPLLMPEDVTAITKLLG
jgi:mannitol operon transcriptional antiterminator